MGLREWESWTHESAWFTFFLFTLSPRYNALLQMFGEKAEEYDELRMEQEHLKSMYKQQIEELIQKESFRR